MQFDNQEYTIKIWNESDGKLGRFVAVDTETTVVPFTLTPELVTFQAYSGGSDVYYVEKADVKSFLTVHRDSFIIGQNFPFDSDVLSKFLEGSEIMYGFYDNNRIRDVGVLHRLYHLADKGFVPFKRNLQLLSKTYLGVDIVKDETRENFGQFLGSKISEIPSNYLEYGAIDVIVTYKVYFALVSLIRPHDKMNTLLSQDIQVKGDLALNHIYKNGIGFDLTQRDGWIIGINKEMDKHADILASWGWVRGRKGIKDVYAAIIDKLELTGVLPITESGDVSSKADDLKPFRKHAFIDSFLEYQSLEKATSFVKGLTQDRVHPRYNLLVNTGRTSCSKPNFQQLPKFGGIREMFIPQKGNVFLDVDYSAIELATLAQVCYDTYGYSVMRDRINDGEDLHRYYASIMHGCEAKDVTKQQRQEAKAASFGYPGGLGIDTFIEFSRGYGLDLTREQAQEMKDVWFEAFPEMRDYMQHERGEVFTLTGRKRGNTTFCAEKNTPFQGLASDGFKLALYELDKKGFTIVGQIHDQILVEVGEDVAKEKLVEMEAIMISAMSSVATDVKIGVEGQILERFTK